MKDIEQFQQLDKKAQAILEGALNGSPALFTFSGAMREVIKLRERQLGIMTESVHQRDVLVKSLSE